MRKFLLYLMTVFLGFLRIILGFLFCTIILNAEQCFSHPILAMSSIMTIAVSFWICTLNVNFHYE